MKGSCPLLILLQIFCCVIVLGEQIQGQRGDRRQPDPLPSDDTQELLVHSSDYGESRQPLEDAGDAAATAAAAESKRTDDDHLQTSREKIINQPQRRDKQALTEMEKPPVEGQASKPVEQGEGLRKEYRIEEEEKEEDHAEEEKEDDHAEEEDEKEENEKKQDERNHNSGPETPLTQPETEPTNFQVSPPIETEEKAGAAGSSTVKEEKHESVSTSASPTTEKIQEVGQTLGLEQSGQLEQSSFGTREQMAAAPNASIVDTQSTPEKDQQTVTPAPIVDDTYPQPVCGVWGVLQGRPQANYKVLYLLFRNIELGDQPPHKEIPSAADMAGKITDDAFEQAKRVRTAPDFNETKSKSANSEFVEGLDDIGKLFEDVEPPDELDVGAVGSSIQEVLMGQGTRIILKRLDMGFNFARKSFITAKNKIAETFNDEDGNLTETIENAARWIWKSSKRVYVGAQAVLDNLIERGISGFLSREEDAYDSSASIPEANADVRALLRDYSRGGGVPRK